jgi:preprotein translocase subunit SecG
MDDAKDLRIKVWLEGYRTDVSAQTSRMNVLKGAIYTSVLNLEMPSDLNDVAKSYILHLSISNADGYEEAQYSLQLQRKAYDMNILSVDYNSDAQAGEVVPFLVVVENGGMEKIRNGYVTVSIPALGVSTRGYFGHLVATESDDSDQVDAVQKIVYLKVPESTKDGLYEVVIQAYNEETTTTVKKAIQIGESSSAASPSLIVTGKTSSNNSNNSAYVVALTVVLAIIFVVLFIVLIVLLTRKERPVEEETSYY